jgi:plastocyanin
MNNVKTFGLSLLLISAIILGCSQHTEPIPESTATPSPQSKPAAPTVTVDAATAGSISGVVDFKGAIPKFPTLDMTADPGCPQKPQPSETVVVNKGKLANVFVYVKAGLPQGSFAAPSNAVVLNQKGCRYIPHVMGIMVGQPFKILNTDTADHNIHSMPKDNPPWNETQLPTDKPIVKTFPNPEIMLPLQCNQHPWMRAYVNVMSNPYYAVSAEDGSFTIKNLPPGEYTLVAVHEKFGEKTTTVKVDAKGTAKADFVFTP